MPIVLDLDFNDDPIAIELINILLYGGRHLLDALDLRALADSPQLRFTYDFACDASSIRLQSGRSWKQRTGKGNLMVNKEGHLVSLQIQLQ